VRLAHLADPHLGIRQYQRQTPSGINQREADVARAFRAAIDGVIAAAPDAVVIAGDLFHSVRPTNAAIVFAFQQLQRLREALPVAPIVLIAGNHDTPRSVETGTILRLFEELGVDVAIDEARRLVYSSLDLTVFAVPHQALAGTQRPSLRPEGKERHQVLVLHGEIEGMFPPDRSAADYGGALVSLNEFGPEDWTYVALGHYHVQHRVAGRAWYAGSLEYVSPNLWGELIEEEHLGPPGKGWLLADLDSGRVERRAVPRTRDILDLEPVQAEGKSAATVDALIAERLQAVPGGIADKIVRLRVFDIPRHIARELNHAALRTYKSEALNFHLDLRRPVIQRVVGLTSRPLPAELDREAFVRLGRELMDSVERDLAGS
jgi:exonuclease SbcD